MNAYAIQINIDGSCPRNPSGAGGCAGVLELPDTAQFEVIFQEGYAKTTNNRMELTALLRAMEYIKRRRKSFPRGITSVEVWTDSEYAILCFNAAERWRKNWVSEDGAPLKNVDLIKQILTLKASVGFPFTVGHVKGKSSEITRRVDSLAKAAARFQIKKVDAGYILPRASKAATSGVALPFRATGQTVLIKVYEHSFVRRSKDICKIKFEVKNDGIVEKFFAYTDKEIDRDIDRHNYYWATFSDEIGSLPRILSISIPQKSDLPID